MRHVYELWQSRIRLDRGRFQSRTALLVYRRLLNLCKPLHGQGNKLSRYRRRAQDLPEGTPMDKGKETIEDVETNLGKKLAEKYIFPVLDKNKGKNKGKK